MTEETTQPTHEIDWGSATIEDATLSVKLTGDAPKEWRESFDPVLALLGRNHSQWGEIALRKSEIKVTEVQQDAAPDLRHFLESIVQQVNSDLEPEEDEPAQTHDDPRPAADQALATTFREFAEE